MLLVSRTSESDCWRNIVEEQIKDFKSKSPNNLDSDLKLLIQIKPLLQLQGLLQILPQK